MRYRPVARQFFFGFVVCCLLLGWCGAANPDDPVIPALQGEAKLVVSYTASDAEASNEYMDYVEARRFMDSLPADAAASMAAVPAPTFAFRHLSLILTAYYFGYFFILFFLGLSERPKEQPESIHKSVLKRHKAPAAVSAE